MINLDNKRFVLNDNTTYEVIEYVTYDNKIYVYLVNVDDEIDSDFKELLNFNGELYLNDIDSNLFESKIYNLFLEKFRKY